MEENDMADSLLFQAKMDQSDMPALVVEGSHTPDALAGASGVYIAASGSAMLQSGNHGLKAMEHWLWLAVEGGGLVLENADVSLNLRAGDCCMLPPGSQDVVLDVHQEARVLWMMVGGALSGAFLQRMGALPHRIMKQGALPSQLNLAKHIVQATVRVAAAEDASSAQLQQLLWAMLASHSGQPVAMDAVLSHEIAKVVDAMRKNQYRDSFSLADMAALSRMPVETFRKRFVSEVGMPPQSYQLFCKMERAKTLLKEGCTVRQAGIEVGMNDPYHFSKTFKNIVGMSPSAYSKTALK
ncbi:MAG: helix-turn-helix transcriptional regulator [Clostridiales bacterium]|nr:helix-turn-helix transcriptional regulator [Clostridiales bacterium]